MYAVFCFVRAGERATQRGPLAQRDFVRSYITLHHTNHLSITLQLSTEAMSDAFFNKPRPFTKRKREDGPQSSSRSGTSSRGNALTRGSRGGARGAGRGARGASRGARGGRGGGSGPLEGKRAVVEQDEELSEGGSDSGNGDEDDQDEFSSEEDDAMESAAQKRLRLSQMYLEQLKRDTTKGTLTQLNLILYAHSDKFYV